MLAIQYHNYIWHVWPQLSCGDTCQTWIDFEYFAHGEINERYYNDVIMDTMASQITTLTIVYSIVYPDADQRKHQSAASLAFVRGIHRGPVNSPHKWPVTRKMFPFDNVIMRALVIPPPWCPKWCAAKQARGGRYLTIRSRDAPKPRDLSLKLTDRSEICHKSRQQCCRCAC